MPRTRAFLLSLPEKLQIVIIVCVTVTAAFAAALATRALFDLDKLAVDTGLTTAVYEVLGTIYAILLAFVISGIWQNYKAAVASVQAESYALLGIVNTLGAYPKEHIKGIRSMALAYAQEVIDEWQELGGVARGEVAPQVISYDAAMALLHAVQSLAPANEREIVVFEQALVMLNNWLNARRERLQSASGGNAEALWPLLLAGALVLFAFHGLFAAKSTEVWAAHLLGLSAVVGLSFYLIFSLDSPFTGRLSAHEGPFRWVIDTWQSKKPETPNEPEA